MSAGVDFVRNGHAMTVYEDQIDDGDALLDVRYGYVCNDPCGIEEAASANAWRDINDAYSMAELHCGPAVIHAYVWGSRPDPNCYGCQGTGKVVGFHSTGFECACRWLCDNHERLCVPEDES